MRLRLNSTALLLLCGGYGKEKFDEFDLLIAVLFEREKDEEKKVHTCLKKLFYKQLNGGERARRIKYNYVIWKIESRRDENIQVKLPDKEEQVIEFVKPIGSKYSLLGQERVFAVMDGLELYLEQSGNHAIQNTFYNGWKHDHYISNIL
eukprot:3185284-Ditylum_brightwellii.AAC.1